MVSAAPAGIEAVRTGGAAAAALGALSTREGFHWLVPRLVCGERLIGQVHAAHPGPALRRHPRFAGVRAARVTLSRSAGGSRSRRSVVPPLA
jgi:hypothetical protein